MLSPGLSEAADNQRDLEAELADTSERDPLVTVACVSHPATAEILRTKLETVGIPAVLTDAETVSTFWLWSVAVGGVKVQVRQSDHDAAIEALGMQEEWKQLVEDYRDESADWDDTDVNKEGESEDEAAEGGEPEDELEGETGENQGAEDELAAELAAEIQTTRWPCRGSDSAL